MKKILNVKIFHSPILYSFLLFMLGMFWFAGAYKVSILLAVAVMMFLFATSDIQQIKRPVVMLLVSFVLWSGLTIIWAVSGKFYLREFSKIVFASMFFFLIILKGKRTLNFGKKIFSVMAGISALCGAISVEAAATGVFGKMFNRLPGLQGVYMGFETGTRMTGIFANPNVLASILALGIFFSVTLLFSEKEKKEKILYAVYSGCSAYAFLLCFSMGAIAAFFVALILYVVFAGNKKKITMIRLMLVLVPSVMTGFLAFPCFDRGGFFKIVPLLLLVLNILVVLFLSEKVEKQRIFSVRIPFAVIVGIFLLGVSACWLNGAYVFGGELRRSMYPTEGEHTLSIEADGSVEVTILSQTKAQTMMHTNTVIYQGEAQNAKFTVPEGSIVCYVTFSAAEGTKIREALIDGKEKIYLDYLLLPDSIANRLQGLFANENLIQRMVYYRDGLKLFQKSPLLGSGVGAFQTGITSVQEFYYESRYVHNTYIQILVESGIIGLLLYIFVVLWMVVLLIRKRKMANEETYGILYPAVAAVLSLLLLHSAFDVCLSSAVCLCMLFAVFGIIVLYFDETAFSGKRTGVLRVSGCMILTVFGMTVGGNLVAEYTVNHSERSPEQFLKSLEKAAVIDIYDKNNHKLSYLYLVLEQRMTKHLEKANQYAGELLGVQSNSIPQNLVLYYAKTGQFEYAVRAAMAGADYSASNPKVWNQCISLLGQVFFDSQNSPLLTEGKALIPMLEEYADMWRKRNETAMEPISLDENNADFFVIVGKLRGCEGNSEQIREVLNSLQTGRRDENNN